jgi:two-component system response regulator NreC
VVVGEADDGITGVDLVQRVKPDVLVVDLMMPGLNGLDLIKLVLKSLPKLRILVLSMQSADSYVVEALNSGGGRYLSPKLAERLLTASAGTRKITDPYETLTPREREILHLVVDGNTSAQIAKKLVLSPRTVELHRSRIMKKLDLHSQTDIFRYALERGLLSTDH